jgi:lipoprotein NlpI
VSETPVVPPPATPLAIPEFIPSFDEDEETRVLRLPSELVAEALTRPSSSPNENQTIRAPELGEQAALAGEASGGAAAHGPGSADETRVPLAPRLPSLDAHFEPSKSDRPSARAKDSISARPPIRSQLPTVERMGPSSVPPPALSHDGGTIDPIAREAWIARAEWLESEAHAVTDAQAKARALLVASELWALVGDLGRAREVATEASVIARNMGMVSRQLRWLAALENDWRSVASLLELEARGAATPEARVHAAYLCAEVNRLELDDREAAKKKFDLCVRAQADDARAHVQRLAEQLGTSTGPAKLRLPELPELGELARVSDELGRLRVPGPASPEPVASFEEARRALSAGARAEAAAAVLKLADVEGLSRAARWLSAALLAHEPTRRQGAVELLQELVLENGNESARRALAARALELGTGDGLSRALDGATNFSAADRLALSALGGAPLGDVEALLEQLSADAARSALATGVVLSGAVGREREAAPKEASAKTAIALGRRLVSPKPDRDKALSWLAASVEAFRAEHPEHALSRALTLELSVAGRDILDVAAKLLEWPNAGAEATRDNELASALAYELGSEPKLARQAYERALLSAPNSEFATRALMSLDGEAAPELLERLAEAEGSGTAAALHFLEAALRRGSDFSVAEPLLDKAVQADSRLSLVQSVGAELAHDRADSERWLTWLRAKRDGEQDSLELAVDALREVLALPEANAEARGALVEQALLARPNDATLYDFHERSGDAEPRTRAAYREAAGARANGLARGRFLLEAAAEQERDENRNEAAALAWRAIETTPTPLGRAIFDRLAPGTSDSTRLTEELIERAKATEDASLQRELYDRLYELDRARGVGSPALVWQSAILERSPRYLPALRRLEVAYFAADRRDELEGIEARLAESLDGSDVGPHARLAARLRLAAGNWGAVRGIAELALRHDPKALWALRALSAQARAADEPAVLLEVERKLSEQSSHSADKATLSLRASESAARLSQWDQAQTLLEVALEQIPEHLVALTTLAEVLEAKEDYAAAARTLEAVAEASRVDAHRVAALYQAAVLWLDRALNPEQGRLALEQAVLIDLGHEEAVARLQSLYVARGDRQKLADLLARRLERTTDPEERIAIEVTRGRALAEVGEPAAAREALSAALDANPDHVEALEAFAEVCLSEGDWLGAEQAFIRLARHAADPARQAQIYRRLGELYDTSIPNAERAELAYQEVLKREPDDDASVDRLVLVYARMGAKDRAVQVQSELLERATKSEQKRDRTLRVAHVLEQIAGDVKRAEATLERARKESPYDGVFLRALVELHFRNGEARAGQMLLDRSAADARRALATGRFEPALFDVLATVADLRGNADAAAVAHATLAALSGEDQPVRGAGPAAGDAALDDLLAPDLMAPSLRALLKRTGDVLDTAFPVDARALRAGPLPASSAGYLSHVQDVARAFGFPNVEVLVSPALGATCVPGASAGATLLFGQALLDSSDDAARYCLLIRALKVLQARGGAVARTAPIDLWPMMAALLSVLVPSFAPQAVDARKFSDAKARIAAAMPSGADPELATLALEASSVIGNRGSQLGTAMYQWGNRTALLAVGDAMATLRAIGAASGGQPAPLRGPERVKWIVRNAEARDIAIFGVSEVHAEARRRLGLRG